MTDNGMEKHNNSNGDHVIVKTTKWIKNNILETNSTSMGHKKNFFEYNVYIKINFIKILYILIKHYNLRIMFNNN